MEEESLAHLKSLGLWGVSWVGGGGLRSLLEWAKELAWRTTRVEATAKRASAPRDGRAKEVAVGTVECDGLCHGSRRGSKCALVAI